MKIVFDTGYELTVKLVDNDFVKRWCRLLSQEVDRGTLSQEHTFSNFIPESLARQRLEQSITTVNNFLRRELIPMPRSSDYDDPEFYNQLHQRFEMLAGPDWDQPTRLMLVAPEPVKKAIRDFNRYCHRLERRPYTVRPWFRVEFHSKERLPLLEQDYELLEDYTLLDHCVVLDYSTLGKSLADCYNDGLTADYAGMKQQQHYAANFVVIFDKDPILQNRDHIMQDFNQWLERNNVTNARPGAIKLGHIEDRSAFDKIKQCAKIIDINLE